MSYCVNCGVELDSSLKKCPLCNTPVINPNSILYSEAASPYPEHKGKIEPVNRKDLTIFSSITLSAIAICCGLLNCIFFENVMWSVPVIGLCLFIWICLLPITLLPNLSGYLITLLDCTALGIYIYMISYLTAVNTWYYKFALPLIIVLFVMIEILVLLTKKIPFNFLIGFLYLTIFVAIICVTIELLLDAALQQSLALSWSAVVLTVCAILSIMLITILSIRRIRHMVQKRLYF